MGRYLLGNFNRDFTGVMRSPDLSTGNIMKMLGHAVIAGPLEAHTAIDFTGPPGSCSGLLYGLYFQLGKWEYLAQKADEWIEVSPVNQQYYNVTMQQKSELEGKIKAGLASASQAVADYELILHDKRKYREFLEYFGYMTKNKHDAEKKIKFKPDFVPPQDYNELYLDEDLKSVEKRQDQHSLKAVFIDQVDVHTGDGISMRSIVSRWPTLISDFMRMDDTDLDQSSVMKKLDTSRAEAVVLITKNKLYLEWKSLFLGEILSRYKRVCELVRSRDTSVEQYREWLKPVIARHRMLKEGLDTPGGRSEALISPMRMPGYATSLSMNQLWAWKDFIPSELYKGGSEDVAKYVSGTEEKMQYTPYDKWTKHNLIFGEKLGLINEYPWITDAWVKKCLDEFYNKLYWLNRNRVYYTFFILTLQRTNMRDPTGSESEDGVFDVNLVVMSHNVLFTKLLELRAKQEELNMYVDKLLGIPHPILGAESRYMPGKDRLASARKFLDKMSLGLKFSYGGMYEKNFNDRLTNFYFLAGAARYNSIVNWLKGKMGMGR